MSEDNIDAELEKRIRRILNEPKKEAEVKERIVEKKPYGVCTNCGYPYWNVKEFEEQKTCPRCGSAEGTVVDYT